MINATDGWAGVRLDLDRAFQKFESGLKDEFHDCPDDGSNDNGQQAGNDRDSETKAAVNGNDATGKPGGEEEARANGKSPGGRPRALDDFNRGRVCSLLGIGLSQRAVAAVVGCHQATISRALKDDPKFASDVEFAKQKARMLPLIQVITASRNSWRAAAWLVRYVEEQQAKADFDPADLIASINQVQAKSQGHKEGGS